jgi:hypothetical protein
MANVSASNEQSKLADDKPVEPRDSLFSNLSERERSIMLFFGLVAIFVAAVFALMGWSFGRATARAEQPAERLIRVISVSPDGKERTYKLENVDLVR